MMQALPNICRICLDEGAKFPIFESANGNDANLLEKLLVCLKEKLEDIKGYPRNVCSKCLHDIDVSYNFISKYRTTCKILATNSFVKEEYSQDICSDVELDINYDEEIDIKPFIDLEVKPLTHLAVKKNIKIKNNNLKTIKKSKLDVSSFILEGAYTWMGEKWCLTSKVKDIEDKDRPRQTKHHLSTKITKKKTKIPSEKKSKDNLCDLCGKILKDRDKLLIHIKHVHFPKKIPCSKCDKVFAHQLALKKHFKRKHENIRNFVCEECGIRFVFKSDLQKHIKVKHEMKHAKKKHKCTFCDKEYSASKSVIIHERSVHTGDRPATCSVCDSAFFHEDYLKEHMRLHTGETPFKCPVCDRGYAQRGNMKSHLRIHRLSELDSLTLAKLKPNYIKLMKP